MVRRTPARPRVVPKQQPQQAIWNGTFTGPWIVAAYRPTALWSLRTSMSTSSGGKTLLVPTPYSVKLALVDAAIQQRGFDAGVRLFERLRGRPMRISPPVWAVVSASLVKVRRLERSDANDRADEVDAADVRMFTPTVGFREYVSFSGPGADSLLRVAVLRDDLDDADIDLLAAAARGVTYSGKRGGFLQFAPMPGTLGLEERAHLATGVGFTLPLAHSGAEPIPLGTIQLLDELAAGAEWERVSTFGSASARVSHATPAQVSVSKAVERVFVPSAVPYRRMKATRSSTLYQRVDDEPLPSPR